MFKGMCDSVECQSHLMQDSLENMRPTEVHELVMVSLHELSDASEKTRSSALTRLSILTGLYGGELSFDVFERVTECICRRLSENDRENCEEFRIRLLQLLTQYFQLWDCFPGYELARVAKSLKTCLVDSCADIRIEAMSSLAELASRQMLSIDRDKELLSVLLVSAAHRQWKVRKAVVETLPSLVSQPEHIDCIFQHLLSLQRDNSEKVRRGVYQLCMDWFGRASLRIPKIAYVLLCCAVNDDGVANELSVLAEPCIDLAMSFLDDVYSSSEAKNDAVKVLFITGRYVRDSDLSTCLRALVNNHSCPFTIKALLCLSKTFPFSRLFEALSALLDTSSCNREVIAKFGSTLLESAVVFISISDCEAFVAFAEKASVWPQLLPGVRACITLFTSIADPAWMTTANKKRLFLVFGICPEAVEVFGESFFDDVSIDARTVRAVLSFASRKRILEQFSDHILPIIQCLKDQDVVEGLEMIHIVASRQLDLTDQSARQCLDVMSESLKWAPGLVRNKVRKLSLVCLREFIPTINVNLLDSAVIGRIAECLDDSWSPDNRLLALWALLDIGGDRLSQERAVVAERVLERLEDSQNRIRVTACDLIPLMCCGLTSIPLLQRHLNDDDASVRAAVSACIARLSFM